MMYIYPIHERRIKRIQYLVFMAYMSYMPYIYLIHVLRSTAYNGLCVRLKKENFFLIKKGLFFDKQKYSLYWLMCQVKKSTFFKNKSTPCSGLCVNLKKKSDKKKVLLVVASYRACS